MAELTLYGFAPSTYTRTTRMTCVEAGAAYVLEPLDFKASSHLALHPFGKMPVMRHGAITLFESLAICSYVDTVFGGSCQPAAPADRARMLQWISALMDNVYPPVVGDLAKAERPDAATLEEARSRLRIVEQAMAQAPFLDSKGLTLADLFLFPMLDFALAIGGADLLAGCPQLMRWHGEMAQRSSSRETAS